jgi:c-di-GMP-binding flagellar brake protein YcgR
MNHQNILTLVRKNETRAGSQSKESVFPVERRRHRRISIELPCDYSPVEGNGSFRGIVEDASEGGLHVYSLEKVDIGAFLKIEIFFARGRQLTPIKAIAKVIWSDLAAQKGWAEYQYGIQFHSFLKGYFNRLKVLLKEAS